MAISIADQRPFLLHYRGHWTDLLGVLHPIVRGVNPDELSEKHLVQQAQIAAWFGQDLFDAVEVIAVHRVGGVF